MGNYNILYKDYYRKFNNKKSLSENYLGNNKFKEDHNELRNYKFNNYSEYSRYDKGIPYFKKSYIERIIMRHLVGTLCLFIIVIGLKSVVTPETKYIYSFCKKEITREYGIEEAVHDIRSVDYKSIGYGSIKEVLEEGIEKIKSFNLEDKLDFLRIDP